MGDFLCPDFLEEPDMSQYLLLLDTEEREFFREIYETYRDEMFYTAYVILANVQDTEDILQETFIALIANIDKMKENTPQKNWNYIATIVKNKAINLYNKRKRQTDRELPINEEVVENVVDEAFDLKVSEMEHDEIIMKLLEEVTELQRDILLLYYYHDLSYAEIGKIVDRDPDAVRHLMYRARKKLQSIWKEKRFFGGS